MAWKVSDAGTVRVHGKIYFPGHVFDQAERPVLDDILEERHWEIHLREVKVEPKKVVPIKAVAKKAS